MDYIRGLDKAHGDEQAGGKPEECFFCAAATAPADQYKPRLLLWQTAHTLVLINRYPYTNGHLLVAPKEHIADPQDLTEEQFADFNRQFLKALALIKKAISPQGFNIGINLGRCAGAGVPGHLHQHVVPRWNGDTNFMHVVGEVKVVPQAMSQLYDELIKHVPTL